MSEISHPTIRPPSTKWLRPLPTSCHLIAFPLTFLLSPVTNNSLVHADIKDQGLRVQLS